MSKRRKQHPPFRNRQSSPVNELNLWRSLCPSGQSLDSISLGNFIAFIKIKGWNLYKEDCVNRKRQAEEFLSTLGLTIPSPQRGENYSYAVELPLPSDDNIYYTVSTDAPGLNTIYTDGQIHISGTATGMGTYQLHLTYIYDNAIGLEGRVTRSYPIEILQNPRELWKHKATPPDIPYYKKDYDSAYVQGKKRIVAASQRGRSHAHKGDPRDDHFAIAYDEESGWHILAVADGLGQPLTLEKGLALPAKCPNFTACKH